MSRGSALAPRGSTLAALSLVVAVTTSTIAVAQSGDRWEVAGGLRFVGPESLGQVDANERNPSGGDFRLFTADSSLGALAGLEVRLGVRLTQTLRAEGVGSYGASDLNVTLESDAENAASVTASERVRQYTAEGAVVQELPRWQLGARATPCLSGGAGYVRALHEDRTLIDEGWVWHGGGGVNLLLGSTFGLRIDARALFQQGILDDDVHVSPAAGVSAFIRF
jgi:hypothetical protein